jgi:hypothetical protein
VKILLDECVPRALKQAAHASSHVFRTVQEAGWAGKKNGDLLELAEKGFDVLITLDTNLRYQQNLAGRRIALIVVRAASNRLAELAPPFPACIEALDKINPGECVYIGDHD